MSLRPLPVFVDAPVGFASRAQWVLATLLAPLGRAAPNRPRARGRRRLRARLRALRRSRRADDSVQRRRHGRALRRRPAAAAGFVRARRRQRGGLRGRSWRRPTDSRRPSTSSPPPSPCWLAGTNTRLRSATASGVSRTRPACSPRTRRSRSRTPSSTATWPDCARCSRHASLRSAWSRSRRRVAVGRRRSGGGRRPPPLRRRPHPRPRQPASLHPGRMRPDSPPHGARLAPG